jgi:hypothetical protein
MLWIVTDDIQNTFALNDLAIRTALFDRCRYLHGYVLLLLQPDFFIQPPILSSQRFDYTCSFSIRPDRVSEQAENNLTS